MEGNLVAISRGDHVVKRARSPAYPSAGARHRISPSHPGMPVLCGSIFAPWVRSDSVSRVGSAVEGRSMTEAADNGVRRARTAARNARIDPFGFDPVARERAKPFFRFLYKYYWRVEVEGLEYLPTEGPVLLAANHSGALPFDAAMISLAVEEEHPAHRIVRMLYAKFVTDLPYVGTLFSRLGGVEASTTNGATLLKRGEAVGIFP